MPSINHEAPIDRLHFLDREIERASAEAKAKGRAEGKAEGEATALLKVLRLRGIELTDKQRESVASNSDPVRLELWLDRALTATSADEIFKD
jgi:hypothetical protein